MGYSILTEFYFLLNYVQMVFEVEKNTACRQRSDEKTLSHHDENIGSAKFTKIFHHTKIDVINVRWFKLNLNFFKTEETGVKSHKLNVDSFSIHFMGKYLLNDNILVSTDWLTSHHLAFHKLALLLIIQE